MKLWREAGCSLYREKSAAFLQYDTAAVSHFAFRMLLISHQRSEQIQWACHLALVRNFKHGPGQRAFQTGLVVRPFQGLRERRLVDFKVAVLPMGDNNGVTTMFQ